MSTDTSPSRLNAVHDEPVNVLHEVDASTATTGSTLSSATLVGGGLPTLPGANQATSARQWVSNPPTSDKARKRTLVLCFDGTGDQFDDDASPSINNCSEQSIHLCAEFECYSVFDMLEEGRSEVPAGVLSGACQSLYGVLFLTVAV